MTKRLVLSLIFVVIFATNATASTTDTEITGIHLAAHWRKELTPGIGQDFNFFIEPTDEPVSDVFFMLVIHPDTNIFSVQSTAGLHCSRHDDNATYIMCSANRLTNRLLLTISGTVTGPGDNGRYVLFRVGNMIDGSPYALVLKSNYYPGGTIPEPTGLQPDEEPNRKVIFLPIVRK